MGLHEKTKELASLRFERDLELARFLRDKALELRDPNLAIFAHGIRLDARKLRGCAWGDSLRARTDKNVWEVSPLEICDAILASLEPYQGLVLVADTNIPDVGEYLVYWKIQGPEFKARVYVNDFDGKVYAEGNILERGQELLEAYLRSYETAEKIFSNVEQ
jgi:hypothetical protein